MKSKFTLIIILLIITLGIGGYYFKNTHATVVGQWHSVKGNKNLAFYNDGTMNFDGLQAKYHWLGNDNMRIEVSGVSGNIMKLLGADIVLRVTIKHKFDDSRHWGIHDTLHISSAKTKTTVYQRSY